MTVEHPSSIPSGGNTISAGQAGSLLGLSTRRIRQLAEEGWFAREQHGRYPLVDVVQGYIRCLHDRLERMTKQASDTRLRDAKVHEIELRIAERDRSLIDLAEAEEVIERLSAIFIESFAGLPRRITRDPHERRRITAITEPMRQRLAVRFAEISRTLMNGEQPDEDDQP